MASSFQLTHLLAGARVLDGGDDPDDEDFPVGAGQQAGRRMLGAVVPLLALLIVEPAGRCPDVADAFGLGVHGRSPAGLAMELVQRRGDGFLCAHDGHTALGAVERRTLRRLRRRDQDHGIPPLGRAAGSAQAPVGRSSRHAVARLLGAAPAHGDQGGVRRAGGDGT